MTPSPLNLFFVQGMLAPADPSGWRKFKFRCRSAWERVTNPDKIKQNNQEQYWRRREDNLQRARLWREQNPERTKELAKGRDKVQARDYVRQKRANDPVFRLVHNLRSRIKVALKGVAKSARTRQLIGTSIENLWERLEKQFRAGMTRSNYGRVWHVDHIKPCAAFDLTDPEQQKVCFHYSNLQPLFAEENLRKGDRV